MEGNQMKMRDALKATNKFLESAIINGKVTSQDIAALRNIVSAALSAPRRNCDRFNTGDLKRDAHDAMEAMLDEGVAGYRGIAEYLLSPIHTEQKGDTDGSK